VPLHQTTQALAIHHEHRAGLRGAKELTLQLLEELEDADVGEPATKLRPATAEPRGIESRG
jgi:hypothetical protein